MIAKDLLKIADILSGVSAIRVTTNSGMVWKTNTSFTNKALINLVHEYTRFYAIEWPNRLTYLISLLDSPPIDLVEFRAEKIVIGSSVLLGASIIRTFVTVFRSFTTDMVEADIESALRRFGVWERAPVERTATIMASRT